MTPQEIMRNHDMGYLTRGELIVYLAKSDCDLDELHVWIDDELIEEVKKARENGEYIIGGITREEVEERAAKGSPAAQAILEATKR